MFFLFVIFIFSSGLIAKKPKITKQVILKTTQEWDQTTLPAYPQGQPEITILKYTIPPHTKLPLHKHPYINAGVILKGHLKVTAPHLNKEIYLKQGDPLCELVNKWHYGQNDGDENVEILVFYAGIKGQPLVIEKKNLLYNNK